jgi:hypothetical protein
MTKIWMGVNPDVEVNNVLGDELGLISTPWSNPLTSYELHHSQIESLVGLCAKKFEWEFIIQPQVAPKPPGMNDLALNMGIAAHQAVHDILKGGETAKIDEAYDRWVLPCITDPTKEEKIHDEFQLNVFSALDWIGNNLNYSQISSEQPFVIPAAHKLSPTLADIDPRWKLAGSMDIIQLDDANGRSKIVDLKFRGRSQYARNKASSQAAMYGLASFYYGYEPEFTYLEVIKGKVIEQKVDLPAGKYDWLYIKARQAISNIETGVYPLSPSGWWCSSRYCKWWSNCRGKYEPDTDEGNEDL